jgi:hypothetical protein
MASPVVTLSQTARLYVPNVGAALCVEAGREAARGRAGTACVVQKKLTHLHPVSFIKQGSSEGWSPGGLC